MNIIKKQIRYNRSKRTQPIKYIVIHETDNTNKGADSEAHYKYFDSGNRYSSADFFVDSKSVWQINDYTKYYTYHCGDGKGKYGITNNNSIGIEICVNSDGNYTKAFEKAIELTKYLMENLNIKVDKVVRHYDASRKNCPSSMSKNNWKLWHDFHARIKESEGLTMTQYEELKKALDEANAKIKSLQDPMIYNYIDKNMPEFARATIQKLVDRKILNGDKNGLNLTYDMLRILVLIDRAGAFD